MVVLSHFFPASLKLLRAFSSVWNFLNGCWEFENYKSLFIELSYCSSDFKKLILLDRRYSGCKNKIFANTTLKENIILDIFVTVE